MGGLPREPEHLRVNSKYFALMLRDKRTDEIMSFVQRQENKKVVGALSKSPKRPRNHRDVHKGKWRCTYDTEYICEMFAWVAFVLYEYMMCSRCIIVLCSI